MANLRLYYKSDYKIRETFKTQGGETIDPRHFNFTFTFIAGKENTFTCSHTIGAADEWVNCVYDSENNAVLCMLDNHNLLPGLLKRELTIEETDSEFPDNKLDYITFKAYEIELIDTTDGDSLYDIYDEEIVIAVVNAVDIANIIHSATEDNNITDSSEFEYTKTGTSLLKTTWLNIKAKLSAIFLNRPIPFTYEQLNILKENSSLIAGQQYIISDYRTKYTQPVSNEVITCEIEPLILTAITTSAFSKVAYSTLHTQDVIYYSFDNNALNAPGADMGYIMRRVDTLREVDVPFDFRQVKFRRWGITATEYNTETTYAKWSTCKKNDKLYISVIDSNIGNDPETTGTESSTLLTYKWIYVPVPIGSCVANDSLGLCGYATFVPTGEYEDYLMFSDDTIYSQTRNFKIFLRGWRLDNGGTATDHDIWIPVNSVFFNYGNDAYTGVDNCLINGDFFNNTFLGSFGMNQTFQTFYHNFFCSSCTNNFFQSHIRYNFFAKNIEHNLVYAWDLSRCLFGGRVETCSIGGCWYDNIFAYDLLYSDFTGYQQYNSFLQKCVESSFKLRIENSTFKGRVYRSNMFGLLSNNIFEGTCEYNFSEGVFQRNIFNFDTSYNKWNGWTSYIIANGIYQLNTSKLLRNTTFNSDAKQNTFDTDVRYMTFPAMTKVHVGKGVYSKDLSSIVFDSDKIYRIDKLPSGSLKRSYLDNSGVEVSEII